MRALAGTKTAVNCVLSFRSGLNEEAKWVSFKHEKLLFNCSRTVAKTKDECVVCVLRALLPIILVPLLLRSSACISRIRY